MNGRELFDKLYNLHNMVEDTTNVFIKYASLMKYDPLRPDDKYKWRDKKFRHNVSPKEYFGEWVDEDDGEFDEDDENEDENKDEL